MVFKNVCIWEKGQYLLDRLFEPENKIMPLENLRGVNGVIRK